MRNFRHPVTATARDLNGRARVVYSGRDPVERERMTAKALKMGWTELPTTVHEASARGLEGLARPAKPGRLVSLPPCAARSKDTPDRNLFDYVHRLATQ